MMPARRSFAGALLLLGALAPAAVAQEAKPAPVVHRSRHYQLEANGDVGDAAEYLKLAEALYGQLAKHFGKTPPTRGLLEIRIWNNKGDYLRGGAADGLNPALLNAGGYYAPSTKRAYFWTQPSAYATRHLFLHELTHQFKYLAVLGGSRRPGQAWYIEGIAEYFAYHRWDGTTLQTGLTDVVQLEKRIPNVIARARAGTFDLGNVIEQKGKFDRGDYWAAVYFLMHGADPRTQRQWKVLERKLWKGAGAGVIIKELLGNPRRRAALVAAAREYVAKIPFTWKIEWVNWDMRGDDIEGWSKSQAYLKSQARYAEQVKFTTTVLPGPGRVVIAVGHESFKDQVSLVIEADGTVRLGGRAKGAKSIKVAPAKPVPVTIEARGEEVTASVAGQKLTATGVPNAAQGHVALIVGAGKRRFQAPKLSAPPAQGK